jgi:hypothetical protein
MATPSKMDTEFDYYPYTALQMKSTSVYFELSPSDVVKTFLL